MQVGKASLRFEHPAFVASWASVAGKKEGQGPLADGIDVKEQDEMFGMENWEQAESAMQKQAADLALGKGNIHRREVRYLFAGDLLGQLIATSFGTVDLEIPLFGLYGACSTMGEALALASLLIDGGFAETVAAQASSHFCTAERQYRMPVPYGSQRSPTAQWTATAAGCTLLSAQGPGPYITHVTCGKIVDQGITDPNNMGAAMTPAAYDTISAHLRDTGRSPDFYDLIVTGDLGELGRTLLLELFQRDGVDLSDRYTDCGLLIFDRVRQDVHAGGSGCGCCASVLTGYLVGGLRSGKWQNILFCPTGALHSPTSSLQGESVPGICHAVALSAQRPSFN